MYECITYHFMNIMGIGRNFKNFERFVAFYDFSMKASVR